MADNSEHTPVWANSTTHAKLVRPASQLGQDDMKKNLQCAITMFNTSMKMACDK